MTEADSILREQVEKTVLEILEEKDLDLGSIAKKIFEKLPEADKTMVLSILRGNDLPTSYALDKSGIQVGYWVRRDEDPSYVFSPFKEGTKEPPGKPIPQDPATLSGVMK